MISEDYYDDLRSYGKPILAVGDHGQLPPIHGKFNLMESPKLRLEKIHRQAEGSPIIRMSMLARLEGHIPFGNYGPGVFKTKGRNLINQIKDPREGVVLCGTNRTRTEINAKMRAILGRRGAPWSARRSA
jgi:exodeoxyribonuclease-5